MAIFKPETAEYVTLSNNQLGSGKRRKTKTKRKTKRKQKRKTKN